MCRQADVPEETASSRGRAQLCAVCPGASVQNLRPGELKLTCPAQLLLRPFELLAFEGCMQVAEQNVAHMMTIPCSATSVQLISRHWQVAFLGELQCRVCASSKQEVFLSQVLTSLDAARLLSMLAAEFV